MANNFNLKKFLAEGTLLKENQQFSSSQCKAVFEGCVAQDRKEFQEAPPEDPTVLKEYEQEVQKSKYADVYDLAESLNNLFLIVKDEYESDFIDVLYGTKGICDDLNIADNSTMEFLQIWHDLYYGGMGYSDDEKEESFDEFFDYTR